MQIPRSCLQRHLLATLSLIINKKMEWKQIQNIFASIYQEIYLDFFKLHNLQKIKYHLATPKLIRLFLKFEINYLSGKINFRSTK